LVLRHPLDGLAGSRRVSSLEIRTRSFVLHESIPAAPKEEVVGLEDRQQPVNLQRGRTPLAVPGATPPEHWRVI